MIVEALRLPGVLLIKPRVLRDSRGHFLEAWHQDRYGEAGLPREFVQDNISVSHQNTLRGLHYQYPGGQGKLVAVIAGRAFDVVVDIRRGSPGFGQWLGAELSEENGHQLWIPPGFAHGFLALSAQVVFGYKCTTYFAPECDRSIRWNDPAIGIEWPAATPLLSPKDTAAPLLADCPPETLPTYGTTRG
jgi:dTDP-4-dehydrorhamnose 3,5-epimerase